MKSMSRGECVALSSRPITQPLYLQQKRCPTGGDCGSGAIATGGGSCSGTIITVGDASNIICSPASNTGSRIGAPVGTISCTVIVLGEV